MGLSDEVFKTRSRFAFGSTFSVYVFVGDFDEDQRRWPVDRNLVLQSGVFVNSDLKKCTNCQTQQAEQFLYGSAVPLTKILTDYIKSGERQPPLPAPDGMVLKTLEPDDVISFLRRNLHWRVVDVSSIPPSPLPPSSTLSSPLQTID
jgi:hypothetical protein